MNKFLIFGIHGNKTVQGNKKFFKESLIKSIEKCKGTVDVHIEGISEKNIKKNDLFFRNFFLTEISPSKNFLEEYEKKSIELFNTTKNELNVLLSKGHFISDLFGVKEIFLSNPLKFNIIPEKQDVLVDFSIWKSVYLKNCLDASIKENVSPVLIVMDYLKSQVESLFARDENLFKLLEKSERDTIVLRGFLHSPSKKFIKSKKDVIYEDLINDEILKAYKLHLVHKLDYDKLMELSKSYLDTYMRLRNKKGYLSLEEYKKIILNR